MSTSPTEQAPALSFPAVISRRAILKAAAAGIALVVLPSGSTGAQDAHLAACDGLDEFRKGLLAVGEEWIEATARAGVDYTADPTAFSAAEWTVFAELARQKQHHLDLLTPPDWLDEWLRVQIDAAALQAKAGEAAANGGLAAVHRFRDEFALLVERDEKTTNAALGRCPAFARTDTEWDRLNQDFQSPRSSPVASPVVS